MMRICFLSLILLYGGGCNVIGAVAGKTLGEPDVKAMYLPSKEPMAVIVENWRNPAGNASDAEQLARLIARDLRSYDVAELIDPGAVLDLKQKRSEEFRKMSIAQIGK